MFFISKIQEIIFSLFSQKQVFENRKQKQVFKNRKQKLLPNITLAFD